MSKWEMISTAAAALTWRLPVPGGWLYDIRGKITFVPEPVSEVTVANKSASLLEKKALQAALEASPAGDKVGVGAKGLTDLIEATTRLLQGVEHQDRNGVLLHECDVARIALDNLTSYIHPNEDEVEAYTDNLAHLVAFKAAAFKAFFEDKYAGEPIQCSYIQALFDAVAEWARDRNEYNKRDPVPGVIMTPRQNELSEAPVG